MTSTALDVTKDYPKEIILKDGTGVTLRLLEEGDQEALFAFFNGLPEEELWFLNHDVTDPRLIDIWVKHIDQERTVSLVAVLGGRIVANALLMRKRFGAKSHIGKIRIAVDPDFRERRLGTWMLLDLITLAMAKGLRMLVMKLVEGRDAAVITGVQRLDFVQEAVLKGYLLDRAGAPQTMVIMTKRLPTDWGDF